MSENSYELPDRHCNKVLEFLEEQRENQNEHLCDVCFLVNKTKIYAHRCVLAACSPYFQTMFSGSFKESSVRSTEMCLIDLTDTVTDPSHLDVLLSCLYKGQVKLTPENIAELMFLSTYLMVECVQTTCLQYLSDTFNIHTCISYLVLAEELQLHPLLDKAIYLINSRFHDYFWRQSAMLSLSPSCLSCLNPPLLNLPLPAASQFLHNWIHGGDCCQFDTKTPSEVSIRTNTALEILRNQCRKVNLKGDNFDFKCQSYSSVDLSVPSDFLIQLKAVVVEELGGAGTQAVESHVPEQCIPQDNHDGCLKVTGSLTETPPDTEQSKEEQPFQSIGEHQVAEQKGDKDKLRAVENSKQSESIDAEDCTSVEDHKCDVISSMIVVEESSGDERDHNTCDLCSTFHGDRRLGGNLSTKCGCNTHQSHNAEDSHLIISDADTASAQEEASRSSWSKYGAVNLTIRNEEPDIEHARKDISSKQMPVRQSETNRGHCEVVNRSAENRCSDRDSTVEVLLVFIPGKRMVEYVTAIECDSGRPRHSPGDLEVCVYDIQKRRWLYIGHTAFPGVIDEKSMWRMACSRSHAFFASLHQQSVLQLNLASLMWTRLPAAPVFQNLATEVRSVMPLAIGGRLYILSSDRVQLDSATDQHLTHQQYYRLEDTGDWTAVAGVEHHHTSLPLSLVSVDKRQAFVVKADLMRSMEKSLLILKGGHVFDTETGSIEKFAGTIFVPSPGRFLVHDGKLYIVDAEGVSWQYQQFQESWKEHSKVDFSDIRWHHAVSGESYYPCLSSVSAAHGSSVWELLGYFNHCSTLLEFRVEADGHLASIVHPPPPCRYVTAMAVAEIDASLIVGLEMCGYMHV